MKLGYALVALLMACSASAATPPVPLPEPAYDLPPSAPYGGPGSPIANNAWPVIGGCPLYLTPAGVVLRSYSPLKVEVISAEDGSSVRTIAPASRFPNEAMAVGPDGQTVVLFTLGSGTQPSLEAFDLAGGGRTSTWSLGQTLGSGQELVRLCAASGAPLTVAGAVAGMQSLWVWRLQPGRSVPEAQSSYQDSAGTAAFCLSPDGKWLASFSADHIVRVWEVGRQSAPRELAGHGADDGPVAVTFSPDGKLLASMDMRRAIVWDCASWQPVSVLRADRLAADHCDGPFRAMAFAPDSRALATGQEMHRDPIDEQPGSSNCWHNRISLWDVRKGLPYGTTWFPGEVFADVWSVGFSRDGSQLFAVTSEFSTNQPPPRPWVSTLRRWDLTSPFDAYALFSRATDLMRAGQYEAAEVACRTAPAFSPQTGVLSPLADALWAQGRLDEARETLRQAQQAFPWDRTFGDRLSFLSGSPLRSADPDKLLGLDLPGSRWKPGPAKAFHFKAAVEHLGKLGTVAIADDFSGPAPAYLQPDGPCQCTVPTASGGMLRCEPTAGPEGPSARFVVAPASPVSPAWIMHVTVECRDRPAKVQQSFSVEPGPWRLQATLPPGAKRGSLEAEIALTDTFQVKRAVQDVWEANKPLDLVVACLGGATYVWADGVRVMDLDSGDYAVGPSFACSAVGPAKVAFDNLIIVQLSQQHVSRVTASPPRVSAPGAGKP